MDQTVPSGSLRGVLTPPCSKSYAQRALAASLLAEGVSTLRNIEFCDDTRSAIRCIEALGAQVEQTDARTISVTGGFRPRPHKLNIGESGLSARLFTPIAALCRVPVVITGRGTILHRSMGMMIEPLQELGVHIHHNHGYLPFEVCGPIAGGEISVDGSISSQFTTGLLLALPRAMADTTIHVENPVSTPYINMTIDTATRFGVEIHHNSYEEFFIEGRQQYHPTTIDIEGDWSAAAMLLVAGATSGQVCVRNLNPLSKQADTVIIDALERAGAGLICETDSITVLHRPLQAFEFDATHCPDLFPALAALAAAAEGTSIIRGTHRLTHKESNRAVTLRDEYAKLGIEIDICQPDIMAIHGGPIRSVHVSGRNDHRIAMSLAVAALRCDGEVTIKGAECVAKSYPDFFEKLDSLRI